MLRFTYSMYSKEYTLGMNIVKEGKPLSNMEVGTSFLPG